MMCPGNIASFIEPRLKPSDKKPKLSSEAREELRARRKRQRKARKS